MARPRTDPPLPSRVLVTLGAPFVVWLVGWTPLPILDELGLRRVSDVAVGLGPVVAGFLLVELVAAGMPGARALRVNGPAGRAQLTRWGWRAAAVAMALQLAGVEQLWGGEGLARVLSGTLLLLLNVPLTLGLVWLARLVSRQGLANGYAVLLVADALPVGVVFNVGLGRLVGLLALAGWMAAVAYLLRAGPATQRHGSLVLRAPMSGLVPITLAMGVITLPYSEWAPIERFVSLNVLRPLFGSSTTYLAASAVLIGLLTPALAWLFHRPAMVASMLPDVAPDEVTRWLKAASGYTLFSTMALGLGPSLFSSTLVIPLAMGGLSVAYLTAVLLDAREEYRARKARGLLVPVWEEHRAYAVGPLTQALTDAGISVHARSVYYRALVQVLGPLVPVTLLVPPGDAERALAVLQARNADSVAYLTGHAPSTF